MIMSRTGGPAPARSAAAARTTCEDENRDKTGTSRSLEMTNGSLTREFPTFASRQSSLAEGMGLEPTTGFPAPEFQSEAANS